MDNSTFPVQIVETNENLFGHPTHNWQRDTLIIISFHNFKQIDTKDLEHHNKVLTIGPRMNERIQKLHCVTIFNRVSALLFIGLIVSLILIDSLNPVCQVGILSNHIEYFNFIICSLGVMRCTFLHFKRHVRIIHIISSEPNGREMTPSKFLHYDIAINQDFSHMHWVIPTDFVVGNTFVFRLITVCEQFSLRQLFSQSFYPRRLIDCLLCFLLSICSRLILILLLALFALLFLLILLISLLWVIRIYLTLNVLVLHASNFIGFIRFSRSVKTNWFFLVRVLCVPVIRYLFRFLPCQSSLGLHHLIFRFFVIQACFDCIRQVDRLD